MMSPRIATVLLLLVVCLFPAVSARAAQAASARPVLTIVNWEEWVSPKVVENFERRENATVKVLTFGNVGKSLELVDKNRGKVDILVGSSVLVDQLKAKKRLRKLDRQKLTNMKYLAPRFYTDPDYTVPYLWGFTGIIYRTDLVKKPPRTYADLLALAKEQPGKTSLLTDPVEYAYAWLWGLNGNKADPESLSQLQSSFDTFRKNYADKMRLSDVDYDANNAIASGRVIAAQTYSDYATFLARDQKVPVKFINPDDVCILWMDQMMVMSDAPNPALAESFMNYVTDAKVAARNAQDVKSTSANPMSMQYYDAAYSASLAVKQSFEGTERCRIYKSHGAAAQKFYDNLKPAGIE